MNYLSVQLFIIFTFIIIGTIILTKTNNIKIEDIKKKPVLISMILVFAIGLFVRVIAFEKYPIVNDFDEVATGYDAWSVVNYGVDRYGMSLPVHFVARGSGQNALYAYLAMPFIKLFDLSLFSVRLPAVLISCITLCFVLFIINKLNIMDDKVKLIILFMFVIFPWNICKSRWGLESNIFPDLIFYAMTFIYLGIINKKNKYYVISSIILGLSSYAYGTSYLYLPCFVFITYLYLLLSKQIKIKTALINILIIGLVSLPIIMFVIINCFNLNTYKVFNIFTIPKLYTNRMTYISNLGNVGIFSNYINNIKNSWNIFIHQSDSRLINSVLNYGIYYIYSLPFIVIGLIQSFKSKNKFILISIFAFISALILCTFIEPNIYRINVLWIPTYIFLIYGIISIYNSKKSIGIILVLFYFVQFIGFTNYYFNSYQDNLKENKDYELLEIMSFVKEQHYNELYITQSMQTNYIYYLFVNKTNPNNYSKYAIMEDGLRDYNVISFNKVYFHLPAQTELKEGNVYIVDENELKQFKTNKNMKYKTYDNYIVIYS